MFSRFAFITFSGLLLGMHNSGAQEALDINKYILKKEQINSVCTKFGAGVLPPMTREQGKNACMEFAKKCNQAAGDLGLSCGAYSGLEKQIQGQYKSVITFIGANPNTGIHPASEAAISTCKSVLLARSGEDGKGGQNATCANASKTCSSTSQFYGGSVIGCNHFKEEVPTGLSGTKRPLCDALSEEANRIVTTTETEQSQCQNIGAVDNSTSAELIPGVGSDPSKATSTPQE